MLRRAASAAVIVVVVAVAMAMSPQGVVILAAVLAALAGSEAEALLVAAGRRVIPRAVPACAAALVVIAGVAIVLEVRTWGSPAAPPMYAVAAPPLVLVALGAWSLSDRDPKRAFVAWEASAFGAVYVGLLTFAILLAGFSVPALVNPSPGLFGWFPPPEPVRTILDAGRGWPLALIAAVWSFDTGAYLVGRAVGRRPFFARISPNKTVEGFIGGVAAATIVVTATFGLLGRPAWEGLVMGPLLAVAAQAGDLAESALKRAAGAKDSGTLIPGHGGVLDRIDSILFAAPVLALYVALASA